MKRSTVHIFIDGSFHPTQGAGYGFVAVDSKGRTVGEQAEPIYDEAHQTSTSAELIAALRATKWAERKNFRFINIHHDYTGVSETAILTPRPTNLLAVQYHEFFGALSAPQSRTKVFFHKVKGHSGCPFNGRAHRLATCGRQRNLRRLWLSLIKQHGRPHPALSLAQLARS